MTEDNGGAAIRLSDLKREIDEVRDDLNMLALMGAVPLWNSLLGRLDDLYENLEAQAMLSARKKETGE